MTITTSTLFEPEKAEWLAAELNEGDREADEEDAWAYVVKHDPAGQGYSFIEIYDEDGQFVGKL